MKTRDLYRLPIGTTTVKDDIYTYLFDKSITDDGTWIIRVTLNGRGQLQDALYLHEHEDFYHENENDRWRYGDFKYKTYSSSMGLGMLRVHSTEHLHFLYDIKIQNNGSFKKYVEKEITP